MRNRLSDINPNDKTLRVVWGKIEALAIGETLNIAEHSKGHDELFIKCACMFIDCFKMGEFNPSYTVFKLTANPFINTNGDPPF